MEYAVVALAAALAGIGTGLVGLSAATAMVPLLIVLCPTFGGEHGAFMATAIALASDILGSAVTSWVYAKNKHIDLKHGWLLLTCIIMMCTAGSVAAYFTHQSILGNFSLLLCVAIGIRFLVKPDSKEKESDTKGQVRLSAKEITVSLFFGTTIGFGTGFFGTGGGMMMLIVFTAMLNYDRKTAVGTSTFIMTFTALIASISHILMEPAIVLECWDYLLLSIVVATFFAVASAHFANRVRPKTVGCVTGWILLLLGLVMSFLNNIERIDMGLFAAFGKLMGVYLGYILMLAVILIVVRFTIRVPDYIFRKLLHTVAYTSIIPLIFRAETWRMAALAEAVLLIPIVAALRFAERFPFYSKLFVEKAKHEVVTSFMLLFGMMIAMIAVIWGGLGAEHRYIIVAAIMAWGPGDAMAAIVGKNFGRHKLTGKYIEGVKSVEGSTAMAITSFVCTLAVLLMMTEYAWYSMALISALTAIVSAITELYTKRGMDTVTVPLAASVVLALTMLL